jgi:hypothetical protein
MVNSRRETRFRPFLHLALGAVACVLGSTASPISAQGVGPPAIQLRGMENLGIGTSPSKAAMAKVGSDLLALYAEYQAHLQQTSWLGAAAPAFRSSNPIAPIAGGSVVIDAAASGDPQALAADLRALGVNKVTVFGRMVSARVPIPAIPGLNRRTCSRRAGKGRPLRPSGRAIRSRPSPGDRWSSMPQRRAIRKPSPPIYARSWRTRWRGGGRRRPAATSRCGWTRRTPPSRCQVGPVCRGSVGAGREHWNAECAP